VIRWRLALVLLGLGLIVAAPARAQLIDLGDLVGKAKNAHGALHTIGEDEEIRIGGNLAGLILGAAPLVNNPAEQRYVNTVGRWLSLHCERAALPWKFAVIDTSDVNAFSAPGGYVLISQGLFDRLRNESELAAVLSHEIAHVVRKHHLKALQHAMGNALFGDVGHALTGGQGGLTGALSAGLINGGRTMFMRGLDKEDEFEADRMAVIIAARSGYSPYGMVGVLQTLGAAPQQGAFALMFATHPPANDRLDRLDKAMGNRLDSLTGLVDDLQSFVDLRNPPPLPPPAPAAPKPVPQRRKRPHAG
jgi:predicted Zn-dependent protease